MKIIIISDLHITENGVSIWDTDTLSHFISVKCLIESIPDVDAVIVCGDIADDGSLWAYNFVTCELDKLNVPVYYVPGNHDNVINMKTVINPHLFLKSFEIHGWKFILLNSVMPDPTDITNNMSRGLLNEQDLTSLKEELKTEYNVCLVLHHPPIEQDGWLNRKLLDNKEDLNSIIVDNEKIKLVLYGHTHYHSIKTKGHTTYICAPSVGFAFDKDLPKFQIDKDKEGFLILTINGENIDCVKCLIQ